MNADPTKKPSRYRRPLALLRRAYIQRSNETEWRTKTWLAEQAICVLHMCEFIPDFMKLPI